jgi:hypothetical protein
MTAVIDIPGIRTKEIPSSKRVISDFFEVFPLERNGILRS